MFLGVDGGGTKTAMCLIDQDGHLVAQQQVASVDYFTHGIEIVGRILTQGVREICETTGIAPDELEYAFFGLPTYGEASGDVAALDAAPRAALGHERYRCNNDMVCGWAGSLGAADGINVISGTGSMTYGERAGKGARVGGWGELFGDEGSAYWIAIRGLMTYSQMSDGRLAPGPLVDVLRHHLDLAGDLDLVDMVLNRWKGSRSEIAALSRQVGEAAARGDASAAAILADAGRELASLVDCTRRQLGFEPGEVVPVSYSGGVFGSDAVLAAFTAELDARDGQHEIRQPLYTPDVGAALYAAKLAGRPLEPDALARLRTPLATATSKA
ncbi:BadF/BadG/BcrA/BcrD ATPase family protein [Pengzhenrongella phosphoraccumulans]|uniref:BadF/BadG/BcrA/BcrD ATPase family protein n=1 Tax=Pengzhenrongella phosphoraccumulans TaxID=3114394 RepID=UPI003890CBB7